MKVSIFPKSSQAWVSLRSANTSQYWLVQKRPLSASRQVLGREEQGRCLKPVSCHPLGSPCSGVSLLTRLGTLSHLYPAPPKSVFFLGPPESAWLSGHKEGPAATVAHLQGPRGLEAMLSSW